MENQTDDDGYSPIYELNLIAGDTPETDQLLRCDEHKVDEDTAEFSAYRRMVEHAQWCEECKSFEMAQDFLNQCHGTTCVWTARTNHTQQNQEDK